MGPLASNFVCAHLSLISPDGALDIYLAGCVLLQLRSSARLLCTESHICYPIAQTRSGKWIRSRFLPAACSIAVSDDMEHFPPKLRLEVGQLYRHFPGWERRLGSLSTEVLLILLGRAVIPKAGFPFRGKHLKNLPTWTNKVAQDALWPTIAKWTRAGILEYCVPGSRVPKFILPCGAVPKDGPPGFRLITDGRVVNPFFCKWPTKHTTLSMFRCLLSPKAHTCSRDLHDAYHLCPVSGCEIQGAAYAHEIITGTYFLPSTAGVGEDANGLCTLLAPHSEVRMEFGCSPLTCVGNCDKSLFGIQLNGHTWRFASFQFGISIAASPLHTILQPIIRNISLSPTRPSVAEWVDDLCLVTHNVLHDRCEGSTGGCPVCEKNLQHSTQTQLYVDQLLADCGIPLSGKGHDSSQVGTFVGICHDTLHNKLLILDKKLCKIQQSLVELLACVTCSPRRAAALRGRLQHYTACLPYLEPCITELTIFIGTQDFPNSKQLPDFDWDREIELSIRLKEVMAVVLHRILKWAPHGRPIWPEVASSLYGDFLNGTCHQEDVPIVSCYDASFLAGAAKVWLPGVAVADVFLFKTDHLVEQVHREALTGLESACSALAKAKSLGIGLEGRHLLLRNDCSGALSALEKGSFSSPFLQDLSLRLYQAVEDYGVIPLFLHAPGSVLVQEGIDSLSRDFASLHKGPSLGPVSLSLIHSWLQSLGLALTFDLFASPLNNQCPRYASLVFGKDIMVQDAFSMPSWAFSFCNACRRHHPEFLLCFPPSNDTVKHKFLVKAFRDGLHGVIIVERTITNFMWRAIQQHISLVNGVPLVLDIPLSEGYLRFNNQYQPKNLVAAVVRFSSFQAKLPSNLTTTFPQACLRVPGPLMPPDTSAPGAFRSPCL